MASVEVIPYFPGTTGKILDLIAQDGSHWGIHACQTFTVGYNLPTGADPPADTIPALTSALVLSVGAMNGRTTFDPTIGNWVVVTAPGTRELFATPLEEIGRLPTLLPFPYFSILAWVERGVVRPWQWSLTLPAGQEGAILRFKGGVWEVYPPGTEGQVLTMIGGYPTWGVGTLAATTSAPVGTTDTIPGTLVAASDGNRTRVISLWNGSTNSNIAPPAGWNLPGYDDSGWGAPVVYDRSAPFIFANAPSARSISAFPNGYPPSFNGVPYGAGGGPIFLVRQHVTGPSAIPSGYQLTVSEDDTATGYLNGTQVYYLARTPGDASPAHAVSLPANSLITSGDNILAFAITEVQVNFPANQYSVTYALSALS